MSRFRQTTMDADCARRHCAWARGPMSQIRLESAPPFLRSNGVPEYSDHLVPFCLLLYARISAAVPVYRTRQQYSSRTPLGCIVTL